MTLPKRIRLERRKGWRLPAGAMSVARPTRWGNPYAVGDLVDVYAADQFAITIPLTADLAVLFYRELMATRLDTRIDSHPDDVAYSNEWAVALADLAGKDLACWCNYHEACHADVLLELANEL